MAVFHSRRPLTVDFMLRALDWDAIFAAPRGQHFFHLGKDGAHIHGRNPHPGSVTYDRPDAPKGKPMDANTVLRAFDLNWKHGHVTRDGRSARHVGTVKDIMTGLRHVFAITESTGYETVQKVTQTGHVHFGVGSTDSFADIQNAPSPMVKKTFHMNAYADGDAYGYVSEHAANVNASPSRKFHRQTVVLDVPAE